MKKIFLISLGLTILVGLGLGSGRGDVKKTEPNSPAPFLKTFSDPGPEYRPWVRWWWPGNDVSEPELRREVALLSENGFGGAEIQVFSAGLKPKVSKEELGRRLSFDGPSFYQHLAAVMDEAGKRGMTIDLTLGSGWPSGGTHISPDQGVKTLLWSERRVRGPRQVELKLPKPRKPGFYLIAGLIERVAHIPVAVYLGDRGRLTAVVAARVISGKPKQNPLSMSNTVELDPRSVQVLTRQVDRDGRLSWSAPEGEWEVIAFYIAPDGERPTLAAQADPGFAVDPLDRETMLYHLEHLLGNRSGLARFFSAPFRAFFNDSLEFKCERHFTPDFIKEFGRRRNYDITPYLPAVMVPGADNFFYEGAGFKRRPSFAMTLEDCRLRYDYSLTVSDLFVERFVDACTNWAADKKLLSRLQAHGVEIDLLRAYGHADLAETEQLYAGGSELFLKMASSAGHLYHRPLISAEAMVWAGKDYMTTPLKIKAAADKLFTSGINQIIFHGFPYHKNHEYGETGWDPFSSPFMGFGSFSSNISEANSFWKYMAALNRYLTRCQYALRQGRSEVDVLVYYPFLGFPSSLSSAAGHNELLFNGWFQGQEPPAGGLDLLKVLTPWVKTETDPRVEWLTALWPLLQDLENSGYTWEWVNDESMAAAESSSGNLMIRGNTYQALVLANAPWLTPAAAERLAKIAEEGAAVLVVGKAPAAQPGFNNYQGGDREVQAAVQKVLSCRRGKKVERAGDAAVALLGMGALRGIKYEGLQPIRHQRRRLSEGDQLIFFRNPTGEDREFSFAVQDLCENGLWLEPWTGAAKRTRSAAGRIAARLPAYGSMLLACEGPGKKIGPDRKVIGERDLVGAISLAEWNKLPAWPEKREIIQEIPLGPWELSVSGDDVAGGKFTRNLPVLADWRELKELRYCSSPGYYRTTAIIESVPTSGAVRLELGRLYGAAEVRVNDELAGVLLAPPSALDITKQLRPGKNLIEIKVVPALQNRLVGKGKARKKGYTQFKGQEDTLLPNGITGPTRIEIVASSP